MAEQKMTEIERESLKDLKTIVGRTNEWDIEIVVIGGYAVRAYTNAYRHTKDIDLAIAKEEKGKFLGLLKSLNYVPKHAEFGIAASRRFDLDFIDIHISVGRVLDISTGLYYPITPQLFRERRIMAVRPKFDANQGYEAKAPVVDLSTLLVLKFLPKGRPEKDAVDIISLLLDRSQEIDIDTVVKKCINAGLARHVSSQLQEFAKKLNEGEISKIWSNVTGTNMIGVQTRNVQQFLRKFGRTLKGLA